MRLRFSITHILAEGFEEEDDIEVPGGVLYQARLCQGIPTTAVCGVANRALVPAVFSRACSLQKCFVKDRSHVLAWMMLIELQS